ncbi:hypothetical protein SLS58_009476 [Diplodia intermedia]|uniref:Carbohydrate kinase PfkB domain-containing protein n=1 Tax=Diplodia intermedia TaxID=856260 RepID=A0ABR3TCG0_9PEZI
MQSSFAETQPADAPVFVSLGMLVLDELQFPFKETLYDVPGGSGAYSSPLLHAATFHTLADPAELSAQVSSLLTLRNNDDAASDDHHHRRRDPPIIIWEPRPPSCTAANLDAHARAACRNADVFSPNHVELLALFGETRDDDDDDDDGGGGDAFDRGRVEACARRFLDAAAAAAAGASDEGGDERAPAPEAAAMTAIVVRAGEHGCFFAVSADRSGCASWLPAYYDASSSKVVDTTGAGNAFLGAFAVAFHASSRRGGGGEGGDDVREAAVRGSVAASFALEQVGLPEKGTTAVDGRELWNGEEFAWRLREYRRRVG